MAAEPGAATSSHVRAHGGPHLLCLWLSIVLWGLATVTVMCASGVLPDTGDDGHCKAPVPATVLVIVAMAYIVEVLLSSTRRYLDNICDSSDTISFVKRIKLTPPKVGYGIECSHLEPQAAADWTWSSTEDTDSTEDTWRCLGGANRANEASMVPVATWRATEEFEYDSWKDVTGDLEWLHNKRYAVVLLHLSKVDQPEFMDTRTEQLHALKKRSFWEIHRPLDRRFELFDYVEIDGFQRTLLAARTVGERPWWLTVRGFNLISFLGLSWPYRLYLNFRTLEASVCVRKRIQCEVV